MRWPPCRWGPRAPVGTVGNSYAGSGGADPTAWFTVADRHERRRQDLDCRTAHPRPQPPVARWLHDAGLGRGRAGCSSPAPTTTRSRSPTRCPRTSPRVSTTSRTRSPSVRSANVVVGDGATKAAPSDQEAAFNAVDAPTIDQHLAASAPPSCSAALGRLVITDSGGAVGPRCSSTPAGRPDRRRQRSSQERVDHARQRRDGRSDVQRRPQPARSPVRAEVSDEANPTDATAPVDAATPATSPSTLVPTIARLPPALPIIDIELHRGLDRQRSSCPATSSVPQGSINITRRCRHERATRSVQLGRRVLARATMSTQCCRPSAGRRLQLGLDQPRGAEDVQAGRPDHRSGTPQVVSVAIVQVNDYGEYAINSWVTEPRPESRSSLRRLTGSGCVRYAARSTAASGGRLGLRLSLRLGECAASRSRRRAWRDAAIDDTYGRGAGVSRSANEFHAHARRVPVGIHGQAVHGSAGGPPGGPQQAGGLQHVHLAAPGGGVRVTISSTPGILSRIRAMRSSTPSCWYGDVVQRLVVVQLREREIRVRGEERCAGGTAGTRARPHGST